MSNPTADQRRRRYLSAVFALNPLWQSSQILHVRRSAFGLKPAEGAVAPVREDTRQKSAAVRKRIKQLQQEFWTMGLEDLKRQLGEIAALGIPEFTPVVKRLLTVASCRGAFPQLAQEKSMDMPLFRAFKTAVVLPPTEAGYAKEQFLYSLRDAKRVKMVKRSVATLRDQRPLLYALERDWFETLLKLKKPRPRPVAAAAAVESSSFELAGVGWPVFFIGLFVLRVVLRLLADSD